MPSSTASLLKLFLPDFILENFEFKGAIEDSDTFNIELEELNNPPSEWDDIKVLSKGFFPQIVIQDFPIRGHKVFYHIRRRRWLNTESSQVIYRNWTLVEKGTRMTGDFAAFLKEINRYSAE
ncbi:ISAon1 family transposase N-terminal region protein [Pedobacter gandavensis]|uniref:Transposase n=1 Tax=Pedobacter gandavensis TaxID=2679963 RepID=A0ABR6F303_9SPHI|nr:transposase [Pedobacter gandavensis]MBB2151882.1 transposase [Pedobacter gandavensis]